MRKVNVYGILLICIIFACMTPLRGSAGTYAAGIEELKNLTFSNNKTLKILRDDVRQSIYVVKGKRPAQEMPDLRFYRYRVKDNESFWTILSRVSLDIDTLMSVNDLTSPGDVKPGSVIFIPNMRGIIVDTKKKKELTEVLTNNRISLDYIHRVNGGDMKGAKFLFIPCGKISHLERSLFLGTGFIYPLQNGRRTSGFGTRRNPFDSRRYEFHQGIDIACPLNSPVYAARDGQVVFTGYEGGYGNLVVIRHEHGYSSYYGHLGTIKAAVGQQVKCGDLIALSGNTGRTTGPHLHFETRRGRRAFNPGALIRRRPS